MTQITRLLKKSKKKNQKTLKMRHTDSVSRDTSIMDQIDLFANIKFDE